jgi:hypothetical protein
MDNVQNSESYIKHKYFSNYFNQGEKKKVVGLERGPLSLVSTTEELLERKVAAPV